MKYAALLLVLLPLLSLRAQDVEEALKELIPPLPPVADTENGWVVAQNLPEPVKRPAPLLQERLIVFPGGKPGEVRKINRELLAEYRQDNAVLLEQVGRIMDLPQWQSLRSDDRVADQGAHSAIYMRLVFGANVILAEAILLAEQGKVDKAWPQVLAVMKLGRRICESGGPALHSHMGFTLLVRGAQAAAWAGQHAPDAATARKLAADLEALDGYGDIYQRSLEGEFYYILKRFGLFQTGGEHLLRTLVEWHASMEALQDMQKQVAAWGESIKGRPMSKHESWPPLKIADYPMEENVAKWMKEPPPEVLRQLEEAKNTEWGEMIRRTTEAYKEASLKKPATYADVKQSKVPSRDSGDVPDDKQSSELYSAARVLHDIVFKSTTQVRLARVSLLFLAWKHDHNGQLPEKMEMLVPDYLTEIPTDPYDGNPLRYDGRRLRSVGGDLKLGEDPKAWSDDLVVPL